MCGFEEDHMETNFMCGVEGSEPEHAEAVEQLIFDVLNRVAEEGIPKDRLEAVLHQLELSQREVGGDGMPFGLQLIFSCMSAAIHRGDPIGLLDLDGALSSLRAEIEDPGFIKRLVKDLLLDNPHRVRVVMKPDRTLGARLIEEEKSALQSIKDALSDEEKQQIVHLAEALNQRQAMEEDLGVLPEVTVADIPESKHFPAPVPQKVGDLQITACSAGTNGISYHQVITELPELESDLLAYLPVYTQLVTEVGSAGRGYRDTQHIQHSVSGGINAFSSIRTSVDDRNGYKGYLTLSSRTLNTKAPDMVKIVQETALKPDFDEPDRLRELIAQIASRRMNGIASNGHQYAMSAAASAFSPVAAVNEYLSGIPAAMRLKKLADSLNDKNRIEEFGETLASLHERLRSGAAQFMAISDESYLATLTEAVSDIWNPVSQGAGVNSFVVPELGVHQDRAFVVTTQVNYCATAFPTVAESHPDAAALSVLSGVLRNNFLHSELREKGGAYGGGAGYDGSNGIFRFYSYRDPGINETFEAFERSVEWLLTNDLSDRMLEEAVLGIVSSIDAPGSPAGEIRQAFHHQLFGRDADYRQKMRSRFLHVRQDDLKRVAREYLTAKPARALVTSENRLAEIDNGFQVVRVNET
jgi:Zn-dependent M16 (insulinase) family peptidase